MTGSETLSDVAERVWRRFVDDFGGAEPVLCFAPGRLNLIGAHLDYSGGDVLPLAVDLGVWAAARLRDDSGIRLRSVDRDEVVEVDAGEVGGRADSAHSWGSYVLGVWRQIAARAGEGRGVDMVFGGDLPMASGLSSSAALEVAAASALAAAFGVEIPSIEIAQVAHRAETDYVGLRCGIMDQFASALGRGGHALLLHCRDERYEHVPMDPTLFDILVVNTKRSRNLAATEFNKRVDQCATAYRVLCEALGPRDCLAAFREEELPAVQAALETYPDGGDTLVRRASHVILEMGRVARAVESLRSGDVRTLGELVSASHQSTRDLYDVSCEELDAITEIATQEGGAFGARLTGAGFGGCAFALVDPANTGEVEELIRVRYRERFGLEPGSAVLRPGGGPRRVR